MLIRVFILLKHVLRDASKSRLVLFLIVLSLSVAFAVIILTVAVFDGFKDTLERGAIDWLGEIVIRPEGNKASISDIGRVIAELESMENVESFSVHSLAAITIKKDEKLIVPNATVGIDIGDEAQTSKIPDRITKGDFLRPGSKNEIVVGDLFADTLRGAIFDKEKAGVGEEIELIAVNGKRDIYKIIGVLDAKNFIPNGNIYMLKSSLEELDDSQKDSEIVVRLKDSSRAEETKKNIADKNLPITVNNWRDESGYVDDILAAVSFIMRLINTMLLASVFIIVSIIMFINVFSKRRQIGIMKSLGTGNIFIVSIYVLETVLYAMFAAAIGFLIFMLVHLYSVANPKPLLIGDFYTVFKPENLGGTIIALSIAVLGGGFIPAYIAAKTRIIDVIRGNI